MNYLKYVTKFQLIGEVFHILKTKLLLFNHSPEDKAKIYPFIKNVRTFIISPHSIFPNLTLLCYIHEIINLQINHCFKILLLLSIMPLTLNPSQFCLFPCLIYFCLIWTLFKCSFASSFLHSPVTYPTYLYYSLCHIVK